MHALLHFLVATSSVLLAPQDTVSVLIRGGAVYDGSGAAAIVQDIGIRDDRIVFVGNAAAEDVHGRREIDASGLIVSPGFVDPHTHALEDLRSPRRDPRENANYLMQGVTTVVVGNDGGGPVDVSGTRADLERPGIGTNAALLVGFGEVRREVMGNRDGAPTPEELGRMRTLVARAMQDGAVGLSTGLFYSPQSFAETDEVAELAKAAGEYGGVYDSHLRDESTYTIGLIGAVEEAIEIGRRSGLRVNISHIKALGVDAWGLSDSVVAVIRAARAEGMPVTADQYPYEASGTSIHAALLPRWAQAGGTDSLQARFANAATRARIEAEMRENLRRRNGPAAILFTSGGQTDLIGKTLEDVAGERGLDPIDAAVEVILAGGMSIGSFNMNEDDIRRFMQAEFVMTGSDGSSGHPRKYGTYPRKIRRYVLDEPVISMERMIAASATEPARVFGLEDRGTIEVGAFADIAVFDPGAIADIATFVDPTELAVGMRYVLVNGVMAVDEGRPLGTLSGRVLSP